VREKAPPRQRSRLAGVLALLIVAVMLAGCGKKGPPQPPPGEPNVYPKVYPSG
jgi:predicted small lipoprotein YifL